MSSFLIAVKAERAWEASGRVSCQGKRSGIPQKGEYSWFYVPFSPYSYTFVLVSEWSVFLCRLYSRWRWLWERNRERWSSRTQKETYLNTVWSRRHRSDQRVQFWFIYLTQGSSVRKRVALLLSQLQGHRFNPELVLLSEWSFQMFSLCLHGFPPYSFHLL